MATTGEHAGEGPLYNRQLIRRCESVGTSDEAARMRRSLRDDLDAAPDFAVEGSHVVFFEYVVTVETNESFSNSPHDIFLSLNELVSRPIDGPSPRLSSSVSTSRLARMSSPSSRSYLAGVGGPCSHSSACLRAAGPSSTSARLPAVSGSSGP